MTTNRRAKRDARAWKAATGEPYTVARRRSSKATPGRFEPDCCVNCLQELPPQIRGLFCCGLCRETAEVVRYWRRVVRDGRIKKPDVKETLMTRLAHLLAGGYAKQARQLRGQTRQQVWDRDQGRCRECGQAGEEIDHIDGDSSSLSNLQLLCMTCHHRKTEARMVPASAEQRKVIATLERERVLPDEPTLLCDDQHQWQTIEPRLRKQRRERLRRELVDRGCDPGYLLREYSWADMWDLVLDDEPNVDDYSARGIDDDTGFGPDSYFAYAMAKDD